MIQGEQVIETLDKVGLTLTTHRIRLRIRNNGFYMASIMLDQITSCKVTHHDQKWLLVLAIVLLITSIIIGIQISIWGYTGIFITLFLLAIYMLSGGGILVIASANGEISTRKCNYSESQLISFIDKIEYAKNQRYFTRPNY